MKQCCPCADCGTDTTPAREPHEYFMVHDAVWEAAGMGYRDGFLCIGCLETRLGRMLVPEDFTMAPVNDLGRQSERLRDRLGG